MIELEEELLSSGISKKRVVGVILLVGLLIAALTFSVTLFNWLTDSKRLEPNENLLSTIPYQPILTVPPLPWDPNALANILDPQDLADWLNDLNITLTPDQLDNLLDDLLDQYSDMIDGNIDDLDLSLFAGLIGAFLLSNSEAFRIYDYDNIDSVLGSLWKYECFDEFTGTTWQSTSTQSTYNFYPYSAYISKYPGLDILNISMPLSPNQTGYSSFVIPNLFPIPFIMENSVHANNIDELETRLSKTEFNSTILTLDFTSTGDVNMTYELFGLDLPTFTEINNSAVDESYTPNPIKNRYLQLPPDINTYINAHPYFENHYNNLDGIIQDGDNAATIAAKIQNYLENNFVFSASAIFSNPPASGDDIVEWFCQYQEGVWSDFVSAFCAFSRAFGLACRYVDGYNTRNLQEIYDPAEVKNVIPIMQSNIYNWAEIYVPTSTDGSGNWVQFDVCENISPFNATTGGFNISISTNFTEGYRNVGNVANISATLTSINQSVANRIITFRDLSMNKIIYAVSTDQNGNAWTTVDINNSQTIGVHYISATYSSAVDYTNYTITGPTTNINLNLTDVSPSTVNISNGETVNVQGYLEDPLNGYRVSHAYISFLLFNKGSPLAIPNALIPFGNITDDNGEFDISLTPDNSLPSGEYEIQADFNGTWIFYTGINFSIDTYPFINDSSNRLDLNITKEQIYSIWFYINDIEASNNTAPVVARPSTVDLKAKLLNETGESVSGQDISFFSYTGLLIGQNTTNSNGIALYTYNINDNIPAGPNKIYARYGSFENSSYFILDDKINLNLTSCPDNLNVSRSGTTDRIFRIIGTLEDSESNPIRFGGVSLKIYDGTNEVSVSYLNFLGSFEGSNDNGDIYLEYTVNGGTPTKNYKLSLEFNGNFFYPDYIFNLNYITNFADNFNSTNDLKVYDLDEISIIFKIEGNHTRTNYNNIDPPETYQNGENALFEVWINKSDTYAPADSIVYLIDVYTNTELDRHKFEVIDKGYWNFSIPINTLHSGLHKINVRYGEDGAPYYDTYNSTYIVINETATINIFQSEFSVQRVVDGFEISGNVLNGSSPLRSLEMGIYLLNSENQDLSQYLNFAPGYSQYTFTDANGEFTFLINSIDNDTLQQGRYIIIIDFNGTISDSGIYLSNYMVNFSSSLNINLTAGTQIIQQDYYTLKWETEYPEYWVDTDTLIVIGNLTWDNNTGIADMYINVTVKDLAGNIIAYNDTVQTDQFGGFNVSIYIHPSDPWPNYRSDSEIWVYFNPTDNDLDYVNPSNKQFT